jgi:hypothetical protein
MTITRKYYEALIDAFQRLTLSAPYEVASYLDIKTDLYHLISHICQFNLFELTFTDDFMDTLTAKVIHDHTAEKLMLLNELHYELYTCLHTKRLRYGGELMQYMLRIKQVLLQLPAEDIARFDQLMKTPEDYYFPLGPIADESIRKAELQKIDGELKKWKPGKDRTKVKNDYYLAVEDALKKVIANYQQYIHNHYPEIAHEFSFYQKKIRGYLTQAMSASEYEFRIHAYEATDGDLGTVVIREYYDFYPSYFYNLEEIAEKQVSAMVVGLQKDATSLNGILDISFIHRELLQIFLRIGAESDICKFVAFLLKCDNYFIRETAIAAGYRFHLQGRLGDQWYFFEIYHKGLRSTKVICEKLKRMKAAQPNGRMVFVFTSRPEEEVLEMLTDHNVEVRFLNELFNRHFEQENSQLIHWYIRWVLPAIAKPEIKPGLPFAGQQLIDKLNACPPGDQYWTAYEQIGSQIFKYLFGDNFRSYLAEMQSENNLRNHRRDLIVSNNYREAGSFWADMKAEFNCSAIIVDFKNYKEALNTQTFFSVSKYTDKGVGQFAIIFSRKGLDRTAVTEQHSLFRKGSMVIDFSDHELIEMILEKMIGKDPIDRLDSKKFQLVKGI